jgi:hypothetical protein
VATGIQDLGDDCPFQPNDGADRARFVPDPTDESDVFGEACRCVFPKKALDSAAPAVDTRCDAALSPAQAP